MPYNSALNTTALTSPSKTPKGSPANRTYASLSPPNDDRRNLQQRKVHVDKQNFDVIQICMDVPFLEHPYLIGPAGRKSQFMMGKYHSLIHFPDSNCKSDAPKMNTVVITGPMKNAEEVRFLIRERTPLRLAFHLENVKDATKIIQDMADAISSRSLPIRINYQDDSTNGTLKTEWRNEELLVKLCNEFISSKIDVTNEKFSELYTIGIALHTVINPWNQELSYRLVRMVNEQTKAKVFYPPMEKFTSEPPSYFVKGNSPLGVIRAARYLMGLTMFQVSFNIPSHNEAKILSRISCEKVTEWQRDNLVHTSIEPVYINNRDGGSTLGHRIILRSFEFCLNLVYNVRSEIFAFKRPFSTRRETYDFMSSMKYVIPSTVFSEARLCYPLYAVDDERSFNWSKIPKDKFFDYFYGGPYVLFQRQMYGATYDPMLTKNLRDILNLKVDQNSNVNNSVNCIVDPNAALYNTFLTHQPPIPLPNLSIPPPPVDGSVMQQPFVPMPPQMVPQSMHPTLSHSSLASLPPMASVPTVPQADFSTPPEVVPLPPPQQPVYADMIG